MYTAGIENVVKVWDLRKEEVSMTLKGHNDTITGMALSPDGTHLLTNAMDNTLRVCNKSTVILLQTSPRYVHGAKWIDG